MNSGPAPFSAANPRLRNASSSSFANATRSFLVTVAATSGWLVADAWVCVGPGGVVADSVTHSTTEAALGAKSGIDAVSS